MLRHFRAIDICRMCDTQGLPLTSAWLQAVAAHPSVVQTSAGEEEMARAARKYFVTFVSAGAAADQ